MRAFSFPVLVLVLASLAGAQDPIYVFEGKNPSGFPGFGYSVDSAGFVDTDGFADFVIGEPYNNGGRVHVFAGSDGSPIYADLADNVPTQGFFGWSVAGVGDVDGDGRGDFAVGAPQIGSVAPVLPGFAQVLSGADASVLMHWDGDESDDKFGYAVAGVGDFDGNGTLDVIVGADESTDFSDARGYARVFSGVDGSTLETYRGPAPGHRYGAAVAGPGDLDGDGVEDVLVGAPGTGAGYAEARSASSPLKLWGASGATQFDRFGWAVAGAGDVDADGQLDVIVGAASGDYARILRGDTGAVVRVINGVDGDFFGGTVAGIGDVDSDGYDDVVIGAKLADGPGGSFTGGIWVHSGFDGSVLRELRGAASGDRFGFVGAAAGDVDRDGHPDFLVGIHQQYNPGPGRVEVHDGRPPLVGDLYEVSVALGGRQTLSLDVGAGGAGDLYLLLGTFGPTTPGVVLLGQLVPLSPDAYFFFTLSNPNTPPLAGSFGTLDGLGRATATFTLPTGLSPTLAGLRAHHAYGALDPGTFAVSTVSNPVRVDLIP